MRVHVLQHVAFEGLAGIAPWLHERGAEIHYTRFFEDGTLPPLDDTDMVVAMGGPMSVNDEAELPWLRAEKQFVAQAVDRGIAVLGVCLGAQLIANALGARVFRNRVKEIGWFPVRARATDHTAVALPAEATVFHWHGETFDLPAGAVRLASSDGCENQAFQIGRHVVALQFHVETTAASALELIEHCRSELVPAQYIQSEAALRAAPAESYETIHAIMHDVLSYLTVRP